MSMQNQLVYLVCASILLGLCTYVLLGCSNDPRPTGIIVRPPETNVPKGEPRSLVVEMTKQVEGLTSKWSGKGGFECTRQDCLAVTYTPPEVLGLDTITADVWKGKEYLGMASTTINIVETAEPSVGSPPTPEPKEVTGQKTEEVEEIWEDFEGTVQWKAGEESEYGPDKFRGIDVKPSIDFHTQGGSSGKFAYGPAKGKNRAAAFYRWTAKSLTGHSAIRIDVFNPTPYEIGFRLGISSHSGGWCEYQGNDAVPPNGRATVQFDLDSPIYGSRIDTGIARIVLIVDPSESPGQVYVDNIRFVRSGEWQRSSVRQQGPK